MYQMVNVCYEIVFLFHLNSIEIFVMYYNAIVLSFVNSLNFQRDKFAQTLSVLNYLHQYVLDCTDI